MTTACAGSSSVPVIRQMEPLLARILRDAAEPRAGAIDLATDSATLVRDMHFLELIGWREIALRLCSAALIGAVLGLNRELLGKPAGLRTNALVSLGAAMLTLGSIGVAAGNPLNPDEGAVSRTIQGIITGIGFLGAGVILRDVGGTRVHGITTAATIWLAATLGILCGIGGWPVATVGFVLTLLILIIGRRLDQFIHQRFPNLADDPHEPPH
jgi:putative Mg2+ transporter-C (MgtC) family protein